MKYGDSVRIFTENTKVFMKDLSDEEINAYIDTGEPM